MLIIPVPRCICQEVSCKFETKTSLGAVDKLANKLPKKYDAIVNAIYGILQSILLAIFHAFQIFTIRIRLG